MRWKIYYGDGSTFSSDHGSAEAAPPLDIQIILQATEKEGRIILSGHNFYWFPPDLDEWAGGDLFGLFDALIRFTLPVKFGRSMTNVAFDALMRRAIDDLDFPRKSATNYPRETR